MKDKIIVPNWLGFKMLKSGDIAVKNYVNGGSVTILSPAEFAWLKRIKDGKIDAMDPRFPETMLEKFSYRGLIRFKRRLCVEGRSVYRTIHMFRTVKVNKKVRLFTWFFSMVSMICTPLALLYVVCTMYCSQIHLGTMANSFTIPNMLASVVIGIVSHELSHAAAAWGHGSRVFECGIVTCCGIPKGAYVLRESDDHLDVMERIQIIMAGVEMNAIFAAVFMLLTVAFPNQLGSLGLCGAVTNLALAGWNTYSKKADGTAAFMEALEDERLNDGARKAMRFFLMREGKKRKRRNMLAWISIALIRLIPYAYIMVLLSGVFGFHLKLDFVLNILLNFAFLFGLVMQTWIIVRYFRRWSLRRKKEKMARRMRRMLDSFRQGDFGD